MTDKNALYRPGLTAIAAVMALSSTTTLAQVALPAEPAASAPPVMSAPVAPQAAPAPAAPVQTVQSVPETPKLPDIAVAETPAATARTEAPARAAPARTAPARSVAAETPRAATPAPAAAQTVAPAPVAERSVTPADAPATPIVDTRSETAAPAPTMAADQTATSDETNYAGWALIGGGLLLVAGGAAFALSRRPKRRADAEDYAVAESAVPVTATVGAAPVAAPVMAAPAMATPTATAAQVQRQPTHDVVPPRAATSRVVPANERHAALEAMVAEAPSEANPFHSRRNRLRRADFLLRTGKAGPRQGEYVVTEERQPEMAEAGDRWSEMRFRGRESTNVSWKPVRS